jgi:precorrin-3B synthase
VEATAWVGVGREGEDGCPGGLRPHHAADGELLRIRVPGGAIAAGSLGALSLASSELADGRIGLTSRGNLQVRGVHPTDVPAMVERLRVAGLLPGAGQAEHERVRNILASPLSGRRSGSLDDVDPLLHDLDAALCSRPALARLPGRFLFAVDDGTGDVAGERADVLAIALGRGKYAVRPSGCASGVRVAVEHVVAALLAVAEGFLAEQAEQSSRAWRVAELPEGGGGLLARLIETGWPAEEHERQQQSDPNGDEVPDLEPGLIEQRDGRFAVCALTPLGLLEADQVAAVVAVVDLSQGTAADALRITPWRRLVVRDLELPAALAARELLASVRLVVTPGTSWSRITACAGRPGCAKSLTDVQTDARRFAARADPIGPAVHLAGCERGCGTPAGEVVQLIATGQGYEARGARLHNPADRAAAGLVAGKIEVAL